MKNEPSNEPISAAPCGINCRLCYVYLREKKACRGCNGPDDAKPGHCLNCKIKNCPERVKGTQNFCFECNLFPCQRLKQLDKRYIKKFGFSLIENLQYIRDNGLEAFLESEDKRWSCPTCGGSICVHTKQCINCGSIQEVS